MAAVVYIALVCVAGIAAAASAWLLALIAGIAAVAIAGRFELRWLVDHTSLTRHSPRPIPKRG